MSHNSTLPYLLANVRMSHNRIGGRELSHNHMLERPIISRDRRSSVIIETREHVIMRLFEAKMRL